MINLVRPDEPDSLRQGRMDGADWASFRLKAEIRDVLTWMQGGRCAYCESLLPPRGSYVIDHFHPRDRGHRLCVAGTEAADDNWDLTWSNLFGVCDSGDGSIRVSGCSAAKGNNDICDRVYRPTDLTDRSYYVVESSGELLPRRDDPRLQSTIDSLKLNRKELTTSRREVINNLRELIGSGEEPTLVHELFLGPNYPFITTIRSVFE